MRAISIKQPWAHAILHLGKDIENRDWPTKFRGTIAVHASKRIDVIDAMQFEGMQKAGRITIPQTGLTFHDLPLGAILGTVEIIDCVKTSSSPWFYGEYGFVLANPRPLVKSIPFRGALGFWEVPKEIAEQLECAGCLK